MDMYTLPNATNPVPSTAFPSPPSFLVVVGLLLSLVEAIRWCVQDYVRFKALGPGGPPHNVAGWFFTSFVVRPFTLAAADTVWTADYPPHGAHKEIISLPPRHGDRPVIRGIAPQRQLDQTPDAEMHQRVRALFTSSVVQNPHLLQLRVSEVERHHPALYVHPRLLVKPAHLPKTATVAQGELGHIHADTSLHLYFAPADARALVEKGWAQRHRCARVQPWWLGGADHWWNIGPTFLIVYAPRDEAELQILAVLIAASARFMTGGEDVAVNVNATVTAN